MISSVCKNSMHKKWIEGECNFDLHLIVFDDSIDKFKGDTEYICHSKGYKLKNVYKYLNANPQILSRYDYFFLPDDDVYMDSATINSLFDAMRRFNLQIAQPALVRSYYSWPHTLKDRFCKLRYTDFVEMMVPCFSQEALRTVLFTFNENETGWGTESHWASLIGSNEKDIAIIDEVEVVHTRPVNGGQPKHHKELSEYLQKYNLTVGVRMFGSISQNISERAVCDREVCGKLVAHISHWFATEKISSEFIGEDGYFGYIRLLFLFSRITQSQKYADVAFSLLEKVQEYIWQIKDDMTYKHGITGCCLLVEDLAQKGFVEGNPREILEEPDSYISDYKERNLEKMSLAELSGIGRYYQAKLQDGWTNSEECREIVERIAKMTDDKDVMPDVEVMMDALMLMKQCGMDTKDAASRLERKICRGDYTQVEHAYYMFRMYLLTDDEHYRIRAKEELKNITPMLMTLGNALMLSEMMSYEI